MTPRPPNQSVFLTPPKKNNRKRKRNDSISPKKETLTHRSFVGSGSGSSPPVICFSTDQPSNPPNRRKRPGFGTGLLQPRRRRPRGDRGRLRSAWAGALHARRGGTACRDVGTWSSQERSLRPEPSDPPERTRPWSVVHMGDLRAVKNLSWWSKWNRLVGGHEGR